MQTRAGYDSDSAGRRHGGSSRSAFGLVLDAKRNVCVDVRIIAAGTSFGTTPQHARGRWAAGWVLGGRSRAAPPRACCGGRSENWFPAALSVRPTQHSVASRTNPNRRSGRPMATACHCHYQLPARVWHSRRTCARAFTKPGTRERERSCHQNICTNEVARRSLRRFASCRSTELTRADARLLEKHAGEIVGRHAFRRFGWRSLGAGLREKKTRWILEALSRRQKTYYYPIEISPSALAACAKKNSEQIRYGQHRGVRTPYLEGFAWLVAPKEPADTNHLLVLFF